MIPIRQDGSWHSQVSRAAPTSPQSKLSAIIQPPMNLNSSSTIGEKTWGYPLVGSSWSWDALIERFRHHPPQLFFNGWVADYPDPDNFMRVGLEYKTHGWHNDTFARLVGEANRTTDQSKRIELFQQADRILIQEAAIIPLVYHRWHILAKPWVIGLTGNQALVAGRMSSSNRIESV